MLHSYSVIKLATVRDSDQIFFLNKIFNIITCQMNYDMPQMR